MRRKFHFPVFEHTDQSYINTHTQTPKKNLPTFLEPGPHGKPACPVSHASYVLDVTVPISTIMFRTQSLKASSDLYYR